MKPAAPLLLLALLLSGCTKPAGAPAAAVYEFPAAYGSSAGPEELLVAVGHDLDTAAPRYVVRVDAETDVTIYDDAGRKVLRVFGAGTSHVTAERVGCGVQWSCLDHQDYGICVGSQCPERKP